MSMKTIMCKAVLIGENTEVREVVRNFFRSKGRSVSGLMPGIAIYSASLRINNSIAKLFVWDIGAEFAERNPLFLRTFLAGSTCAIIPIDVNNVESLFKSTVYIATYILASQNITSFIIFVVNNPLNARIPIEKIYKFAKYIETRYRIPTMVFEANPTHFDCDFEKFLEERLSYVLLKRESLRKELFAGEISANQLNYFS